MVYMPPAPTAGTSSSGASKSARCAAGSLVVATATALHRLQLPSCAEAEAVAAVARGGRRAQAAPAAAALQAQLLAGHEWQQGAVDGRAGEARFKSLCGLAADAAGDIYTADRVVPYNGASCSVRRVAPDGAVATLVSGLPDQHWLRSPAILSNGDLALCGTRALLLIDLGLTPLLPQSQQAGEDAAGLAVAAATAQLPPRSLPADLGALLDAQPDGTADLTICVGDRRFHAHRLILCARCDYFKQRLADDGFAGARAAELELPDAEPGAFTALLLRWLYTGGADVPLEQARGVAELADRLLLPDLRSAAQAVVAASVTPGSVVDSLLWAARCSEPRGGGGGFGGLLARWYVEHYEEVRREAGASRQRLAAVPALMEELMDAVVDFDRRARKRPRS